MINREKYDSAENCLSGYSKREPFQNKNWKGLDFCAVLQVGSGIPHRQALVLAKRLQHNADYVLTANLAAFFIGSGAYFPSGGGARCRWKWYKFALCLYCCDLKYRLTLQCPFQFRKILLRTSGADYAETPFSGSHLLLHTMLSFPARCLCGLSVCRFSL